MKKAFVTICLALALLCNQAPPPRAQSHSDKSSLRARDVLAAGIKAMGGLEALQAVKAVTREMTGVRTDEGQGLKPVPHQPDYQKTIAAPVMARNKLTSIRDLRGQRASDQNEATLVGGQPLKFRTVVAGDAAFTVYYPNQTVQPRPPAAVSATRAALFRRYPESLLLAAWNRPETLRWLGEDEYDGRKQQVISFSDSDGAAITLFFDAQTALLTKTESLADNPMLGDVANEVVYDDYRAVNQLKLPFRYVDKIGGVMLQDSHASAITLDSQLAEDAFTVPQGFARIDPVPPTPTVKKLDEDVYALTGPYNSLFVVFKEYVLVLEAGFANGYASASIAKIKETAPGKPIRYLVATHFHFDHLSGVRSYIAEGATLVTTPGVKAVIEQAANRPHVRRPDALARKPRPPVIETFTGSRVFDDGAHRVELYEFKSPHCDEMVVAYLPKQKLLFEADLFDISEAGMSVAGDDTEDLARRIQQWGLQVEQILPVHGRLGSIEDLQRALSNRPPWSK